MKILKFNNEYFAIKDTEIYNDVSVSLIGYFDVKKDNKDLNELTEELTRLEKGDIEEQMSIQNVLVSTKGFTWTQSIGLTEEESQAWLEDFSTIKMNKK